jgi:hypothetical protein
MVDPLGSVDLAAPARWNYSVDLCRMRALRAALGIPVYVIDEGNPDYTPVNNDACSKTDGMTYAISIYIMLSYMGDNCLVRN